MSEPGSLALELDADDALLLRIDPLGADPLVDALDVNAFAEAPAFVSRPGISHPAPYSELRSTQSRPLRPERRNTNQHSRRRTKP